MGGGGRTVTRITEWKLTGMRSYGCPKSRWGDEESNDLKKLKLKNWTYLVKERKSWYELVRMTNTHKWLYCRQKQKKAM
jgi:hypothetical protein